MGKNLLIVDDEVEILQWLEEIFRYDFEQEIGVYTARSGRAAMELLNSVKFDVVLTDIHMPQMDGITLFYKVKENWPKCKTVFLTGYQNFDDVYSVFKHRDVRYVLKSERDEAIKKAVSDAFGELERELEAERSMRIQKEQLQKVNFWLSYNFIEEMLSGQPAPEQIAKAAAELQLPLDIRSDMLIFLLRIDEVCEEEAVQMENLVSLLEENLPEKLKTVVHIQKGRHLFLLFQPKEAKEEDWKSLKAIGLGTVEYVQEIFKDTYGLTFSAVVKGTPISAGLLAETAVRLKQVMVGYVGKNHGLILHEEDIEREKEEVLPQNIIVQIPMLKSFLEFGKQEEYFGLLTVCTSEMYGKSRHDVYALEIYYSIATLLLQFINENRLHMQLAFGVSLYKLMKADEHENWPEAAQFLFEVSGAIFKLLGDRENTLAERALKRVIRFIDEHLAEDLPLKTLAEVGGFNASYLSRLFKQTCDQTITEYILNKRMDLARKLLTETDNKIQDVSVQSGYFSSQAFARAFKNSTGLSPAEFRELVRKQSGSREKGNEMCEK